MLTLRASRCLLSSRHPSLHPVQYTTSAMRTRKSGIILRPFSEKSWRPPRALPTSDSGHLSKAPTVKNLAKPSLHEQELARKRQKEKKQKGKSQGHNGTTIVHTPIYDGGAGVQPTGKNEAHKGDKVGKDQDIASDSGNTGVDGDGSHDWNGADAGSGGDCGGSSFADDVGGLFGHGGG